MKQKLLLIFLFPLWNCAFAQEYTAIWINSGYNADVIADGYSPSAMSTNIAVDNANFAFMSADFQPSDDVTPPDYALPLSGELASPTIDGLYFQFAPYYENNSLRLADQDESGVLEFAAVKATNLYFLVTSGSGQATIVGYIYFTDGTIQEIATSTIPDWFYSNALPIVASGFGRVNLLNDVIENPFGNPRLYQLEIPILPENQGKDIISIEISKSSAAEGVANIMGISAKLLGSCPSPVTLEAATTATSATVSWSPAAIAPAQGYDYFYADYDAEPSESQTPTGNVASSITFKTLDNLPTGQQFYFWVRSNCGGGVTGPWKMVPFATGQIGFEYSDGDIFSLYSDNDVTIESENSCRGTLSVTVPDGYQINATATTYSMQTASNGWMSEQRSLLVCTTTGISEDEITTGEGGFSGTYDYSRSGLSIANGATGVVDFELRAWRTFGGSDCNANYNRVVNETWKVIITYEPIGTMSVIDNNRKQFSVYPNPVQDILTISAAEIMTEIKVFNMLGQEVFQKNCNEATTQLNIASLPKGTYLLKIVTPNGNESRSILKG